MKKSLVALLPILLSLACATTGPGGKRSFIVVPTSQEVAIGAGMAEEVARTEKILDDNVWQKYVNEVGMKIVAVSDRQDIVYHFTVIDSDQINAFAAPGGYLYIYTGLLRIMDSETEMAAVIAHEVSHVVARHGIKRLQAAMGVGLAYQLAFGGSDSDIISTAIGAGMGLIFAGYSRNAEREADNFGIHYMARPRYNPEGAIGMFEKLADAGDSRSMGSFEKLSRSHPETQERINNAKAQIAATKSSSSSLITGIEKYKLMKARLPQMSSDSN